MTLSEARQTVNSSVTSMDNLTGSIVSSKVASKFNVKDTEEEEEEDDIKPLYFELSSSLNVELVYVILKSIT